MSDPFKSTAIANPPQGNPAPPQESGNGYARTPAAQRAEEAAKPQPVALEVPVTVNGVRAVAGSDKREPFSETTRTVLIFASGAVIRLSSTVVPGQLLFLTNENTKKEIVCQVVKSKNYKNVSGYVELEFTDAAVGFWGMRFPTDRLGASASAPVAPAITAPGAPVTAKTVLPAVPPPAPTSTASVLPKFLAPVPSDAPVQDLARVADLKRDGVLKPIAPPASQSSSALRLPREEETQSAGFVPTISDMAVPHATMPEAETSAPEKKSQADVRSPVRKRDSDALAELAAQFTDAALKKEEAKPGPVSHAGGPAVETAGGAEKEESLGSRQFSSRPAESSKESSSVRSLLENEGLPIPSWFDPTARNQAAAVPRETAPAPPPPTAPENKRAEPAEVMLIADDERTDLAVEEPTLEAPVHEAPEFGERFLAAEETSYESSKPRSGHGLLIGAIAAVLVAAVAGGAWYLYRPTVAPASKNLSTALSPSATPVGLSSNAAQLPAGNSSAANSSAANPSAANPASVNVSAKSPASSSPSGAQPAATSLQESARAELKSLESVSAEKQPAKKAAMPQIRLAAPVVGRKAAATSNEDVDVNLGASEAIPMGGDSSASALVVASANGPEAPKPDATVGGDAKPAKLLSSVAPMYPQMARNLRISGEVVVDALINENGRVTQMRVASGPAVLHQAAMDAVRQWKYAPATLGGKPVAVHMSVTVKFRLQ